MTSPRCLEFSAGNLRASVDPEMGAALLSFDLATPAGPRPILAPSGSEPSDVGDSSLFPMAPFANRIRNNRLIIAGHDVQPEPNTDDPLCLHGWAWQRAWQVVRQAPDSCQLRMRLRDHGYDLTLSYDMYLSETALQLTLGAVNESAAPVPVGLGLHPYFPRGTDTRISFAADKVWPDGPGHLPAGSRPISECDDYSAGRSLPPVWRNDCYSGWSGQARIQQPSLGYDLDLTARGTDVLMFYADPSLERFALEPQTHVSGETHTGSDGLLALAPGQDTRISLTLSVRPHAPNPAPQVPHAPD